MEDPEACLSAAGLDHNPPSPVVTSTSLPNPGLAEGATSSSSSSSQQRKSGRTNTRASLSHPSALASSSSTSSRWDGGSFPKLAAATESFMCPICCLDYEAEDVEEQTLALGCSHRACRDCWSMYLEGKIKTEGESVRIQCLEDGCDRIVSERVVNSLVADDVKKR